MKNGDFYWEVILKLQTMNTFYSKLGDAKSITIIGCPYCANQSVAYSKGISVIAESSLGGLRGKPYVITHEGNRIKELLES